MINKCQPFIQCSYNIFAYISHKIYKMPSVVKHRHDILEQLKTKYINNIFIGTIATDYFRPRKQRFLKYEISFKFNSYEYLFIKTQLLHSLTNLTQSANNRHKTRPTFKMLLPVAMVTTFWELVRNTCMNPIISYESRIFNDRWWQEVHICYKIYQIFMKKMYINILCVLCCMTTQHILRFIITIATFITKIYICQQLDDIGQCIGLAAHL